MPLPDEPFPWLQVLGRAHLLVLHLPLGMLPALAILEYGAALLRRPNPRGAVLAIAWCNAVAALLATASGLVLAGEGYEGDVVGVHKILGIALGVLSVVAAILALRTARGPFRLVLLGALATMVATGHFGGTLTHGADFLLPARKSTPRVENPGTGDFATIVVPILERTCTQCHNRQKQKGELLLTTIEGLRKGGENGAVLVPGKPDDSPLVTRCELPPDHDDHMPPAEKPQPTPAEIQALRAWVAAGAPF